MTESRSRGESSRARRHHWVSFLFIAIIGPLYTSMSFLAKLSTFRSVSLHYGYTSLAHELRQLGHGYLELS